jgi:hypothetical protein
MQDFQGVAILPRPLSREEWEKEYCVECAGAGEREKK